MDNFTILQKQTFQTNEFGLPIFSTNLARLETARMIKLNNLDTSGEISRSKLYKNVIRNKRKVPVNYTPFSLQ